MHICSLPNHCNHSFLKKVPGMCFFNQLLPRLYLYLRPFLKWFLHTFTRLCELQRLCYGAAAGASCSKQVERSLRLSKNLTIHMLLREMDEAVEHCNDDEFKRLPERAVSVIIREKRIKPRCHPDFAALFGQNVMQIWSYKRLMFAIERLRAEQYDSDNLAHEQKLLELWAHLMPEEPLIARITKQWQNIGFQGDDPKTDFRGMGLLGLENLLYFAKEYSDAAKHVLLHSMHPTLGYTFAIVGINLTSMAYRLLQSGRAKTHFYNIAAVSKKPLTVEHFHKFYCYLLFEFDRCWMVSEPKDIMDFREIYQSFEDTVSKILEYDSTIFKANLVAEDV